MGALGHTVIKYSELVIDYLTLVKKQNIHNIKIKSLTSITIATHACSMLNYGVICILKAWFIL